MSPDLTKWEPKQEWKRRGKDFCVVVSRHEVHRPAAWPMTEEGPHRWCVYAYVYPKHPHFAAFDGDRMLQDAATALPLHGYPSLLTPHFFTDRTMSSVQVGADYNHGESDYRFTNAATPEEAWEVFRDAETLVVWLTDYAPAAAGWKEGTHGE